MAMINKSDWWEDRKTHGGKGDLHKHGQVGYRGGVYWGRSGCCNAPILKINGREHCEKCMKEKGDWYNAFGK